MATRRLWCRRQSRRRWARGDYGAAVVFGKSLGSLAALVVAERGPAAVWFTPLLTNPGRRGGAAPCHWAVPAGRGQRGRVLGRPPRAGADHGMFVPGGLAASAAVLGDVVTAVERFLDDVAWPLR